MSNSFQEFKKMQVIKGGLSTVSDEEIELEKRNREANPNIFPLDVFHPHIKPFINDLVDHYDIPRSYVGLCMLAAYSTAIGSAYNVSMRGNRKIALALWACLEGISSSGKSLSIDITHDPLYNIQENFDRDWDETTGSMSKEKMVFEKLKTVVYRDAHIATLVRSVMPDNPKGVAKHSDEIMEWLNGMNQMSNKEGTDEQFWLSTWNCKSYSGIRAGKQKFVLPRPFVNVIGGIQPTITYKLFAKDRDTTGFIFRVLFAVPDGKAKIARPNHSFTLDNKLQEIHSKCIKSLYFGLPVNDPYEDARDCTINKEALDIFYVWEDNKITSINALDDIRDIEIRSGILGKIKEYVLRFCGILRISDLAYDHQEFKYNEVAGAYEMQRAIRLGEYFYNSAIEVYDRVNKSMTAPAEILELAALVKLGKSLEEIRVSHYKGKIAKSTVKYRLDKAIKEYPRIFNAKTK